MDPALTQQFRALFDAHDEAFRALRAANRHIETANRSFGDLIQAHDEAIQAALAANQAALDLLARLSNGQR
jgi:hypothetical protein